MTNLNYQKIIRLNTEQVSEVTKCNWSVSFELELGVIVSRGDMGAFAGKVRRLYGHEILHEKIALGLSRKSSNCVLYTQLNRSHNLRRLDLRKKASKY